MKFDPTPLIRPNTYGPLVAVLMGPTVQPTGLNSAGSSELL